MDYLEGVVTDYLSADRAMFVNPQCRIQLNGDDPPKQGEYWYCDILAVNFRQRTAYLCEVTLSKERCSSRQAPAGVERTLAVNSRRTGARQLHPSVLGRAPLGVRAKAHEKLASRKLSQFLNPNGGREQMPDPLVTFLEDVTPWKYETPRRPPYPGDTTI